MFLLHKNPDAPPRDEPELAPVGRQGEIQYQEEKGWQQRLRKEQQMEKQVRGH